MTKIDRAFSERIIWSADGLTPSQIRKQLKVIHYPIAVKLDRLFFRRYGKAANKLCKELIERGVLVFNDAKLIEIPSKLEELTELEIELTSPWMLNCMAGAFSSGIAEAATDEERDNLDGLKLFADVCNGQGVKSCAVTVLTSKTGDIVRYEFGRKSNKQVLLYVEEMNTFGFTDVVCSPQEAQAIRNNPRYDHLMLNTPGIRLPDSPPDDQARTMTPGEAVSHGVDRLVIGRPISNSPDPRATIEAIVADMASAA